MVQVEKQFHSDQTQMGFRQVHYIVMKQKYIVLLYKRYTLFTDTQVIVVCTYTMSKSFTATEQEENDKQQESHDKILLDKIQKEIQQYKRYR